ITYEVRAHGEHDAAGEIFVRSRREQKLYEEGSLVAQDGRARRVVNLLRTQTGEPEHLFELVDENDQGVVAEPAHERQRFAYSEGGIAQRKLDAVRSRLRRAIVRE